ncbi:Glycosyl transferase family 2 [Bacteroides faecichinchillae]|uniref:Glycosyl transferase family 2 n=1 Tax=Bacteroides faecichinchillae TaxID=871325 RepID=A0A1M5B9F4_9BACE|nr:glycosyltransferase family 2 protein [Bacteroides faecichinchillae]THG67515.1 glycosyltransferase family 2 protein [Bacteroides faecichinchillae]SHF39036.1 Glycosyl transferase family 2 [Bacteroides faecichinchillae]
MVNIQLPLVSIVVPIFNVERYIDKCLDSLFSQSYINIQYVFVNDSTPDDSMKHVERKLLEYPHRANQVCVVTHDVNKGLTAARRSGLQYAEGEYIWHVDSDDYISMDAVELLVNKANESDADMVLFNATEVYSNHYKIVVQSIPKIKEDYLYNVLTRQSRFELCFRFCKKDLYQGVELDPLVCYGEDYATTPRLIYNAKKIVYLDSVCYYYVKYNSSSYTASVNVRSVKSLERAMTILSDFFLKRDGSYYLRVLSLSKTFLKIHLLKSSVYNNDAFDYAMNIFPDNTTYTKDEIANKDRFILFLLDNKCKFILKLYIKIGLWIKLMI